MKGSAIYQTPATPEKICSKLETSVGQYVQLRPWNRYVCPRYSKLDWYKI